MKNLLFIIVIMILAVSLNADLVISRNEGNILSKEIYANGKFAEVINDRVVSVWDFRNMTLMMINYELKAYTVISYDDFKKELIKQTQAEIEYELSNTDENQRKLKSDATKSLYSRLVPRMQLIRDTVLIANYPALEYRVLNDTLLVQRIWISKKVKDMIANEIPFESMKKVESIFKENRKTKLESVGLSVDSITQLVELIEQNGYVMKRFDYGIRMKSNPKVYATVESVQNEISEISVMKVDDLVFQAPKKFKKYSYSQYQLKLIKMMENE